MKLLSLALLALVAAQDPAPLRRTLKEGTDTYKIDAKVTQTLTGPMGEIPMTIDSATTYVLKTTKVDAAAGTATVEATTTMEKLEGDGQMGAILTSMKPGPMSQTGKLDVRGRLSFDKAAAGGMAGMLSGAQATAGAGLFVEFPEKAVKVGDAWDVIVPKGPMTLDQDQKLVAKLVGEKDLDGAPVWVVSVTGTLKSLVDTSKLPKDANLPDSPLGAMILKGETVLKSEGLVEKATGRTLQMTTTGATKSTIDAGGLTLETTGKLESTMKLVKPQGG